MNGPEHRMIPREPAALMDAEDSIDYPRAVTDCTCDGQAPWCAVCKVAAAMYLAYQHPDSLTVSLLKRRIPLLSGETAAVLLEFAKRIRISIPREQPTEPDAKVLLYSEAKVLQAIRENPGITRSKLAATLGHHRNAVNHPVAKLVTGGDVRAEGSGSGAADPERLYATHDRPILVHQRSRGVFKAYAR